MSAVFLPLPLPTFGSPAFVKEPAYGLAGVETTAPPPPYTTKWVICSVEVQSPDVRVPFVMVTAGYWPVICLNLLPCHSNTAI